MAGNTTTKEVTAMEGAQLVIDALGRVQQKLHRALDGLSLKDLAHQPKPDCNPIGWLAWHLTRVQDDHLSNLAGQEQAWTGQEWYASFSMEPDTSNIGWGHTSQQVAAFRPPDAPTLLDYHDAVVERSRAYLAGLTPQELDRVLNEPQWDPMPTVGVRLMSVVNDNTEHVGQIAYLKGFLQGKGWRG